MPVDVMELSSSVSFCSVVFEEREFDGEHRHLPRHSMKIDLQ
jgi:hypothetical protein